jgi:hypothetical protein
LRERDRGLFGSSESPSLKKKKKKNFSWLALSLSLSSMVLLRRERRMTVGFEIKRVGLKI